VGTEGLSGTVAWDAGVCLQPDGRLVVAPDTVETSGERVTKR